MTQSQSLFGRYIREQGKFCRMTFRKYQLTKLIPNKATGRVPSASSQMGLWHNDDFNSFWKISAFNTIYRKKTRPHVVMKDFKSDKLNGVVSNMRVTPSALYGMDDKGGFDGYILRTPPEELRSNTAEKLRQVMYFYLENPHIQEWRLPWRCLLRKRDKADPWYARYNNVAENYDRSMAIDRSHARYSPYFLPGSEDELYPQRDKFVSKGTPQALNSWWKSSAEMESALRYRLTGARSFEEAHPDHTDPGSYRKGAGAGGGGGQGSPRPRSKTYRSRKLRSY